MAAIILLQNEQEMEIGGQTLIKSITVLNEKPQNVLQNAFLRKSKSVPRLHSNQFQAAWKIFIICIYWSFHLSLNIFMLKTKRKSPFFAILSTAHT